MNKQQFKKISKWQDKTFGKATALSKITHLKQEIEELKLELLNYYTSKNIEQLEENKLHKESEFADCFILLFGVASSDGMAYDDIVKCIEEKMKINYKRKWGKPQANGVVNHLK